MNSFKLAFVFLIAVSCALGQEPSSVVTPTDFNAIFSAGFTTTQELGRQGHRFTESRGDWVLTVENDRKGATRASYVNTATGLTDGECVVIGDSVYERIGMGHWTLLTRAEYNAQQTAHANALKKARAEKDHQTYERIFALANVRASNAATSSPAFRIYSTMLSFASPSVDNKVITAAFRVTYNRKAVRLYKFSGSMTSFSPATPRSDGVGQHLIEADYWFDEKTGAIVKIRTMNAWVSDVRTGREIVRYEWELDPGIEIQAPVVPGVTTAPRS